jgi:CheY-like chemotaxis protein
LIVDDSATARAVIRGYLRAWGCETSEAATASEALACHRSAAEAQAAYSLLVLDWSLAGTDSLGLARTIPEDRALAAPDVILVGELAASSAELLARVGIRAAIPKPVRPSDLHDAIVSRAGHRKRRIPGQGTPLARSLLAAFSRQTAKDIHRIEEALASGDAGELSKAAHRIKGAAATLSLHDCRAAAERIEALAREHCIEEAGMSLVRLKIEAERVEGLESRLA